MARAEHGATFVNSSINDKKVVVLGEYMLVYKMHPPFVGRGANLVAVLNETSVLRKVVSSFTKISISVENVPHRFLAFGPSRLV